MPPRIAGYLFLMMHKLTFAAGAAVGYYFGAKAGRQRYDEINRMLGKLRQSPPVEAAADKARAALDESVEKAKSLVGDQVDKAKSVVTRRSNSMADGSSHGTATVPGVQATQAGPGVQATQAGPGVQATQAGPGVQATQAGPTAAPMTTGVPGAGHSSSR
jgi:hypothetical protein